jgi:cytochrome o ubiquinol oxidase subunit 1
MPLYILGFMGMTRRLSQHIDHEYFPLLAVAAFGTFVILCGVVCQAIQYIVSIRDRKQNIDVTGDPWNGRTLEWSTSSPPPFYNFAKIPDGNEIDAFWYQKQRGEAGVEATLNAKDDYSPIHMPKNTATGIYISAFALVFGFAMIWYIWWLAIISLLGVFTTVIIHSFNEDRDYYVTVEEIKAIEDANKDKLRKAKLQQSSTDTDKEVGYGC